MKTKKILMIVGSLREQSFNKQIALYAKEILEKQVEVSFLHYEELPFFNQDLETKDIEVVTRIRQQVKDADGLWIFTPEYNHSIPGVLKNLIDWLSRGDPSSLRHKKVTFSTAAGASAGASVQDHMLMVLNVVNANVMYYPRTSIALTGEEFMSNELLLDESRQVMIQKQANAFVKYLES